MAGPKISKESLLEWFFGVIAITGIIVAMIYPKTSPLLTAALIMTPIIISLSYSVSYIKKAIDRIQANIDTYNRDLREIHEFNNRVNYNQDRKECVESISELLGTVEGKLIDVERESGSTGAQKILLNMVRYQTMVYQRIIQNPGMEWHVKLDHDKFQPTKVGFQSLWMSTLASVEKSFFTISYLREGCGRQEGQSIIFQRDLIKRNKLKGHFIRVFIFKNKTDILSHYNLMKNQTEINIAVRFMTLGDFEIFRNNHFDWLKTTPDFMLLDERSLGILISKDNIKLDYYKLNIDNRYIDEAINIKQYIIADKNCIEFKPQKYKTPTDFETYIDTLKII